MISLLNTLRGPLLLEALIFKRLKMYSFLLFPVSCAFFKFVFLWSYSYPGCWYLQTRWIGLKTIAHWTNQCPKQERGEAHLPPMRLSFQVQYLFYLLKFLAPENTQTTPQTHAREIWIRKMGVGVGKKREDEKERDEAGPSSSMWSLSQLGSRGSSGLCAAWMAIRRGFQSRTQWILGLIDAVARNVSKGEKNFEVSLTFWLTGA